MFSIAKTEPLSCGSPDSLQNTTVIGKNFTNGATINYSCPKGHALVGNQSRTCENGIWMGLAPTCKCMFECRRLIELFSFESLILRFFSVLDIDCGDLPSLEHGAIVLTEQRTSYGALAQYTCHENYTLIGNENRTCEISSWSGKQPQCLVDWCSDPAKIAGGNVQVNGRRAGATAIYKCDPGYVLIGEPVSCIQKQFLNSKK